MKNAWSVVIALIIGFLPSIALSQTANTNTTSRLASPSYQRFQELRSKLDPAARCSFDTKSNACQILSGKLSFPKKVEPRIAVEQFVDLQGSIMRLKNFRQDFKLLRETRRLANGPTFLTYQQQINGIPVFGGVATFAVDKDGVVRHAETLHIPDVDANVSTTPSISKAAALNILKQDTPNPVDVNEKGLFFYGTKGDSDLKLVYIFEASESIKQWMRWRYIVDAKTGQIEKQLITRFKDESGATLVKKSWAGADLYMFEDFGKYFFHTGYPHDPAPFWIHDMAVDTNAFASMPTSDWPPAPESDLTNPKIHAYTQFVLEYLKERLDQISYCTPGQAATDCEIKVHTNASCHSLGNYCGDPNDHLDWGGLFSGNGNIHFSEGNADPRVTGHEIGHGVVSTYYSGNDYGSYCNETKLPETAGIEEGVVDVFGIFALIYSAEQIHNLSSPLYPYPYLSGINDGSVSYTVELDKRIQNIEDGPEKEDNAFCGAHAFGKSLLHSLTKILLYGVVSDDHVINLDVNSLLTKHEIEWLFIETTRNTQTWRRDMPSFATAMLSVCKDYIPSIYTEGKCVNVERAFLSMGIAADGGYNPDILGPQELPAVFLDASISGPKLGATAQNLQNEYPYLLSAAFKISPLLPGTKTELHLLDFAAILHNLNTPIDSKWLQVAPDSNGEVHFNLTFTEDVNTLTPIIVHQEVQTLLLPIMDSPRDFSIEAQTWTNNLNLIDSNQSNNVATITLIPNFVPTVELKLSTNKQPLCIIPISYPPYMHPFMNVTCPKTWEITVSAKNTGNRPTYPLVQSVLLGPNPAQEKVTTYLTSFKNKNDQKAASTPEQLSAQTEVKIWKDNASQIMNGGCLPKYPYVANPNDEFCVVKYIVTAKKSDQFSLILSPLVPESSVYDNIFTFKISDLLGDTSNTNSCNLPQNLPKCLLNLTSKKLWPHIQGPSDKMFTEMGREHIRAPKMGLDPSPIEILPDVEPQMMDEAVFELLPVHKSF